jgi:lipopolysaccharide/colanic/teichoic acid biosynthesis glycosyltransferase
MLVPRNSKRNKLKFVLHLYKKKYIWAVKFALEYLLIILLAPILIPFFLLICVLIKLDSYGPILYSQSRVGKNGKIFNFYKFRTMIQDAEKKLSEVSHLNESVDGVIFKNRKDPRVTRVGKILRRLSIDESAQIINIMKGDMKLVGPRPPLPTELESYTIEDLKRLHVIPGLTCIWQTAGRSEIPFKSQVLMDKEYISKRSWFFDVILILRTIPAVIFGKGAY